MFVELSLQWKSACTVDILVKAGKLPEAESLTDQTPFIADATILRKITGACSTHGNCQVMGVKKEPGFSRIEKWLYMCSWCKAGAQNIKFSSCVSTCSAVHFIPAIQNASGRLLWCPHRQGQIRSKFNIWVVMCNDEKKQQR